MRPARRSRAPSVTAVHERGKARLWWCWNAGAGCWAPASTWTTSTRPCSASTRRRRPTSATCSPVAGIAAVCILGVAACGLALNISDHRQSDAKLRLMARQLVRTRKTSARACRASCTTASASAGVDQAVAGGGARGCARRWAPSPRAGPYRRPAGWRAGPAEQCRGRGVPHLSHNPPTLLDDSACLRWNTWAANFATQPARRDAPGGGGCTPTATWLPDAYATALFRVTQEALSMCCATQAPPRRDGADPRRARPDPEHRRRRPRLRPRRSAAGSAPHWPAQHARAHGGLSGTLLHSGAQGTLLKAWLPPPAPPPPRPTTHDRHNENHPPAADRRPPLVGRVAPAPETVPGLAVIEAGNAATALAFLRGCLAEEPDGGTLPHLALMD